MSDEIIEKEEVKAPIIPEEQDIVHNQTCIEVYLLAH